ncbi:hypothetical protein [Methylophaga muralis]|uniref:Moderate conductance mechanosensitive channel YbiO n=1 Tax=Methylophaga muralis TaxID=291169 RepID=A0A1E3GSX8_9GAMM|nr:hypothetical protein [Methylophaga muralis]ODN67114.1 Moderate conductance mechanosensitive channel YbiO precursor [Methylophaga muralis]
MRIFDLKWKFSLFLLTTLLLSISATEIVVAETTATTNNQAHYSALADTLENEQSREKLIAELRDLAAAAGTMEQDAESVNLVAQPTFARQIANKTQSIAQEIVSTIGAGFSALSSIGSGDESTFDLQHMLDEIFMLLMVIASTLLMFYVLRSLARHAFRRANNWAEADGEYPVFEKSVPSY